MRRSTAESIRLTQTGLIQPGGQIGISASAIVVDTIVLEQNWHDLRCVWPLRRRSAPFQDYIWIPLSHSSVWPRSRPGSPKRRSVLIKAKPNDAWSEPTVGTQNRNGLVLHPLPLYAGH